MEFSPEKVACNKKNITHSVTSLTCGFIAV